ncbi:right-handed parallel beta-helix repeat-containing protein [Streptomyces sp. NBRC 110028]|uniref:right-handed parallel beta-helix repeat-containing protein n=1 Tax=Streptomyces sp. NBRC 110028 TaxID=1621260 RepID=UPI001F42690F|nr:right-handed parallel beta-helix repeat-containing protein [Streptomyces sp. NBRC 110028]
MTLAVSAWAFSAPAGAAEGRGGGGGEEPALSVVPCGDTAALVAAVTTANNTAGGGTVSLATGCVYTLASAAETGSNGPDGLPVITGKVTISGTGATIRRSASALDFRIAEVAPGGRLTVSGVTLSGGRAVVGGGILDLGALTLAQSAATTNAASSVGGGIEVGSGATATLGSSHVSGNTANDGGGVHVSTGGSLAANSSTFSDNTADSTGGAIANWGNSVLTAVRIETNHANDFEGGGIWTSIGDMTFNGGRIIGNTAGGSGAGIANFDSALHLQAAVVSGNVATLNGGGLFNHAGNTQIVGTNITDNTAHGSQGGGIFSDGGSVSLSATNVTGNNPNNCVPALAGCSA